MFQFVFRSCLRSFVFSHGDGFPETLFGNRNQAGNAELAAERAEEELRHWGGGAGEGTKEG